MRIYDARSTLVHTGSVNEAEIQANINRLLDIVPRVLLVIFERGATKSGSE